MSSHAATVNRRRERAGFAPISACDPEARDSAACWLAACFFAACDPPACRPSARKPSECGSPACRAALLSLFFTLSPPSNWSNDEDNNDNARSNEKSNCEGGNRLFDCHIGERQRDVTRSFSIQPILGNLASFGMHQKPVAVDPVGRARHKRHQVPSLLDGKARRVVRKHDLARRHAIRVVLAKNLDEVLLE